MRTLEDVRALFPDRTVLGVSLPAGVVGGSCEACGRRHRVAPEKPHLSQMLVAWYRDPSLYPAAMYVCLEADACEYRRAIQT